MCSISDSQVVGIIKLIADHRAIVPLIHALEIDKGWLSRKFLAIS